MKKAILLLLVLAMLCSLAACGTKPAATEPETPAEPAVPAAEAATTGGILRLCDPWMYASLNPHGDYQGWYTHLYGLTEGLYTIDDNGSIVPQLAKSYEISDDGLTWTFTLRDDVSFSDKTPLTAGIVIDNLKDTGEKNSRYPYLVTATYEEINDLTFSITTVEANPILVNDLADPDTDIIRMDTDNIDTAPIATGPFVVTEFDKDVKVVLTRNENYWGGKVNLDGVVVSHITDPDTVTMALQNGEIDALSGPTTEALDLFSGKTDEYTITSVPTTRNFFYLLNCKTLSENVRKAIVRAVNKDDIVTMMCGTVIPTSGAFNPNSAFGKVEAPAYDLEAAKAFLAEDGYTINSNGYCEKDGKELTVNLSYYPSRSIDKMSALIQENLKAIGIKAELHSFDDPDATYIGTGDFDIGMYSMLSASAGDPYYFLNLFLGKDQVYNCNGYENSQIHDLLAQLSSEPDPAKRAALANEIQQIAIDDSAVSFFALLTKVTIATKGTSGFGETNGNHETVTKDSTVG